MFIFCFLWTWLYLQNSTQDISHCLPSSLALLSFTFHFSVWLPLEVIPLHRGEGGVSERWHCPRLLLSDWNSEACLTGASLRGKALLLWVLMGGFLGKNHPGYLIFRSCHRQGKLRIQYAWPPGQWGEQRGLCSPEAGPCYSANEEEGAWMARGSHRHWGLSTCPSGVVQTGL